MQKRGHNRNALECRNKFKALKRNYKKVVQHNEISGSSPKSCAFYEEPDMLMGSSASIRPRNRIMRSVHCTTAPVNTEHQSPLLTIRQEDIRPSSPGAGTSGTSRDLCSEEEHEVQRDETLQAGMDRRLQRLEEEVSQLGARVRALEDPGQPGSQTPMVAERQSSGSSEDRLHIVTSEEADDTPRNPPTSDPSAVVVVSSAVPGSSSSSQ
uniref:Uncharacterized protein n=1 Tax=Sphaerodactylus townsendi TaxID=933632 RepID=A0ACB8FM40_9SAUR